MKPIVDISTVFVLGAGFILFYVFGLIRIDSPEGAVVVHRRALYCAATFGVAGFMFALRLIQFAQWRLAYRVLLALAVAILVSIAAFKGVEHLNHAQIRAVRSTLEQYLISPDERIRNEATNALRSLEGKGGGH